MGIERDEKGRFVKGHPLGKRFTKGIIPWNKGKKIDMEKYPLWRKKKVGVYKHSQITRNKISMANLGRLVKQETKEKIRIKLIGKKHSLARRIKNKLGQLNSNKNAKTRFKIGHKPSKESIDKARVKMIGRFIGNKNPAWNGGVSFEPYDATFSRTFKREIRTRDNQVCMNCGVHREKLNKALHIHHINYDKKLSIPENCIALCNKCHSLTNHNRNYWIELLQQKLSKLYNYTYSNQNMVINLMEGTNGK